MKNRLVLSAITLLAFSVSLAAAQPEPDILPVGPLEVQPGGKDKQKPPDKDKKPPEKKPADPPRQDFFAEPARSRGETASGFAPQMLGDIFGVFAWVHSTSIGTQTTTTTTQTTLFNGQPPLAASTVATNPVAQT